MTATEEADEKCNAARHRHAELPVSTHASAENFLARDAW